MDGGNDRTLNDLLQTFSAEQLRFVAERMYEPTDKDAAAKMGISPDTVYNWPNKPDINEAVRLAKLDGVSVAREQLTRLASKAVDKLGDAIDKDDPALSAIVAVLDRVGLSDVQRHEIGEPGAFDPAVWKRAASERLQHVTDLEDSECADQDA